MALASPAPRVLGDYLATSRAGSIALVLGGSAFVGIAAQVVIPLPFTPVPLTLQTFAVLLVGAALGTWRAIASMVVYAAAGTAGVPWFSAGSSGWGGASYGYILGFIVAAGLVGHLAERGATRTPARMAALMVAGNLAIYAIGVSYLKFAIDASWATALSLGVIPFLLGDALKILLAAGAFPATWRLARRFD